MRYARDPARRKYRGEFWLYHWSLVQPSTLREKRLDGHFSWRRGRLRMHVLPDPVTRLRYEGDLLAGQGSVRYVLLRGKGNAECLALVVNDPLYTDFEMTTGVFASVDVNTQPVASQMLLSRKRLADAEVRKFLPVTRPIRPRRIIPSTAALP